MKVAFIFLFIAALSGAFGGKPIIRCQIANVTSAVINEIVIDPLKPNQCQYLVLWQNKLTDVPRKVFDIYPNLETFKGNQGTLEIVRSNTFSGAINVRSIDLSNNSITTIESNAFNGPTNLSHLELSYNKISSLDTNAFQGLTNLRYLGLAFNALTMLTAAPFADLAGLVVFKAQFNGIQNIAPETFKSFSHLKTLDLAFNKLVTLSLEFNHADICHIAVPDNQLRNLRITAANVVQDGLVPCGLSLLAFNNQLKQIDIDSNLNLVDLVLYNNNLTDLNGIFVHTKLERLRLHGNQLTLHVGALDNLERLQQLDLSQNHIHRIANGTFKNQHRLAQLSLAENPIKVLDFANFSGLTRLDNLNLDKTEVLRIKLVKLRDTLPRLDTIQISRTHWNCSFLQTAIDAFSSLGIKMERITDLVSDLKDLDSVNGIECIPDTMQRYSDDDIQGIVANGTLQTSEDYPFNDYDYTFEEKDYFLNLQMFPEALVGTEPSSSKSWAIGITSILTVTCVGVYLVMHKRNAYQQVRGTPNVRTSLI